MTNQPSAEGGPPSVLPGKPGLPCPAEWLRYSSVNLMPVKGAAGLSRLAEYRTQAHRKVFGIGLSRTGTKSLHKALCLLGFRAIHYPPLDHLSDILQYFDAATDTPIACSFRNLDSLYPDSRFILTVRDSRSWLASAELFFSSTPLPAEPWRVEVRQRTYGVLEWDRDAFLNAYQRHVEAVLNHFANRPEQLLVIDITAGEGWEKLCPFLELPAPGAAFPRAREHSRPK